MSRNSLVRDPMPRAETFACGIPRACVTDHLSAGFRVLLTVLRGTSIIHPFPIRLWSACILILALLKKQTDHPTYKRVNVNSRYPMRSFDLGDMSRIHK